MTGSVFTSVTSCVATTVLCLSCSSHGPFLYSPADAKEWIERDPGRKLAELGTGDKAVIDYYVFGCFGDSYYRLEFSGGLSAQVAIYQLDPNEGSLAKSLITLKLTSHDLRLLDGGISIYRAEDACVTSSHTKLRVSWFHDDRLLRRETLGGSWCPRYDNVDAVDPWTLIRRALEHDT